MAKDALVGNAADKNQVKTARSTAKERRRRQLSDLRVVLNNESGRRVIGRILEFCHIANGVYNHDAAVCMAQAAQQQIGYFLMKEIGEADPEMLFTIFREAQRDTKREAVENEALQTEAGRQTRSEETD